MPLNQTVEEGLANSLRFFANLFLTEAFGSTIR
jgi:hypothetical protein